MLIPGFRLFADLTLAVAYLRRRGWLRPASRGGRRSVPSVLTERDLLARLGW